MNQVLSFGLSQKFEPYGFDRSDSCNNDKIIEYT